MNLTNEGQSTMKEFLYSIAALQHKTLINTWTISRDVMTNWVNNVV